MTQKQEFVVHIEETAHFKLKIWAATKAEAQDEAAKIWTRAESSSMTRNRWRVGGNDVSFFALPAGEKP